MKQSTPEKIVPAVIRLGAAIIFLVTVCLARNNTVVVADEKTDALRDHVPRPGVFPPKGAGVPLDGDLVVSDPINRRGALRKGRNTPRHYFAMLPYGLVWYHGAPADVRHIPPATASATHSLTIFTRLG